MTVKKTDDQKLHDKIVRKLNALTGTTDGVCDLCGMAVDQHPCSEHVQAAMVAQFDAAVEQFDEQWSPFLGVDSARPKAGRF